MESMAVLGTVGAVALGTLSLLHALVWRSERRRWSACFALGYALGAVVYAFDASLQPQAGRPNMVAALLAIVAMLLVTLGMIDYVGMARREAARWQILVTLVQVALVVALAMHALPRIAVFASFAGLLLAQAAWTSQAMRREPRSGHGVVLLALMLYPALVAATLAGWVPVALLRYALVLPLTVGGMTVLMTGQLRARRQTTEELKRRREAEEALRALNESLEHKVALRTAELQDMVHGLESFNRSVSHDLRGPLGGIAGVSRLAGEALQRGDATTAQRLLPAITAQAESSAQLVGALLSLARAGHAALEPQDVDLDRLVRETVAQLALVDPTWAVPRVSVPEPLPMVKGDPGLLRQVYVNLLDNARKFTRHGEAPQIEIGARDDGGERVFYVRDNGVGFDVEAASRLFEPFRRLHGAGFTGHGVGLSIVKRIVERHGGRVWADARRGEGATFMFTLASARE
jgi:signal transduction histidine kinase